MHFGSFCGLFLAEFVTFANFRWGLAPLMGYL